MQDFVLDWSDKQIRCQTVFGLSGSLFYLVSLSLAAATGLFLFNPFTVALYGNKLLAARWQGPNISDNVP